jgi:DNA adenine methylase
MEQVYGTEEQIKRLAEEITRLPEDARKQLSEELASYSLDGKGPKQLKLNFGDEQANLPSIGSTPNSTEQQVPRKNGNIKRHIAFGWYGGKFSHLSWLLPFLPEVHHYCEPFSGSAAVLLNRKPSPVETYNDIDGEVVNFFRVLRDHGDALIKAIALTPFSRQEFAEAVSGPEEAITNFERARLFYVRARQVRTGLAQTASIGRWANCIQTSRAGMSGAVSRWLGSIEDLPMIALRLLRVQIENRPAIDVIKLYDTENTLFYCDPPYPHAARTDVRAYGYEMTDEEHLELAKVLKKAKGKVAISSYRCDLMDELYKDWRLEEAPEKKCHSVKKPRREALWMNY